MKIDELKIALKRIIREVVAEEVSKAMGKVLVEMVKEIKTIPQSVEKLDESITHSKNTAAVIKTNNPKLNSALAESSRNFSPLKKTNDMSLLASILDGGFDKVGQNENINLNEPTTKGSNMDFIKQMVAQSPPTIVNRSVLDTAEIPDGLQNVFKKDFRSLIKKMDEQKNHGPGKYIDSSRVLMG